MELKFEVHARIARPPGQVFEAVANPDQLSRYYHRRGPRAAGNRRDHADRQLRVGSGRPASAVRLGL
jgi:uncharacterized protein YndB with AHSA1/START domain